MKGWRERPEPVLLVAVAVFMVAIFHRSSLAVAGLVAIDRFGLSAAQLSLLIVLQLVVYGMMQIPVGLLVDRFGARSILLAGTLLLATGQLLFAGAETYSAALAARCLVGVGDAFTFLCVVRLVNTWVAPMRVPLVLQLAGLASQLGTILAALPMAWALSQFGWNLAYGIPAVAGLVLPALIHLFVRDEPGRRTVRGSALTPRAVRANVADAWAHPGTRLGFWIHFTTPFALTTLGLLWGLPFFVEGQGTSRGVAASLLTVMVVAAMGAAPVLGWFISNFPDRRATLGIGIVLMLMTVWSVVLLWPGGAPLPLLVCLVVANGIGGPAAMIGFDFARTSNPDERLSTAVGMINVAGFIATFVVMGAIGLVLDLRTGGSGGRTQADFAWAMAVQYVVWGGGLLQILRYRRRLRLFSGALSGPAPARSGPRPPGPHLPAAPAPG